MYSADDPDREILLQEMSEITSLQGLFLLFEVGSSKASIFKPLSKFPPPGGKNKFKTMYFRRKYMVKFVSFIAKDKNCTADEAIAKLEAYFQQQMGKETPTVYALRLFCQKDQERRRCKKQDYFKVVSDLLV
ncbi:unnamed protein product [Ambrosiozyma monospora]|uniref:Unnamed protein product n=1 Tax=Ambrosiozyma monospora TaxID=43982 RepID=A0ACB5U8F4_AMBMO|nr:unnamed protein product [Ambrosiozyma monospora]